MVVTAPIRLAVRLPIAVFESALDRVLAGPLTDAVARSLADHRVVERVVTAADLDRLVDAVLDDPRTEALVERALASPGLERLVAKALDSPGLERLVAKALDSPGLERLVVRALDSRFVDALTDRVLDSPEMQRVIGHIASSPELLAAVTAHTETLAEEMVSDVRRRSRAVDEVAERAVRGWLRRPPRAQPT